MVALVVLSSVAYLGFNFGGGGSNYFCYGGSGVCSPEGIFKNDAI